MARRRNFLDRPLVHLQRAAEAHARIVAGEAPDETAGEATAPVAEESAQSQRAKAQRRNQGGKFA